MIELLISILVAGVLLVIGIPLILSALAFLVAIAGTLARLLTFMGLIALFSGAVPLAIILFILAALVAGGSAADGTNTVAAVNEGPRASSESKRNRKIYILGEYTFICRGKDDGYFGQYITLRIPSFGFPRIYANFSSLPRCAARFLAHLPSPFLRYSTSN